MDYLDQRSDEALERQATTSRKGRTRPANLREQVDENAVQIYAQNAQQMWPTPQAFDAKATADWQPGSEWDRNKIAHTLPKAVALWPTPKAQNHKGASSAPNRQGAPDLQTVVKMLPTPTTPRPHDSESTVGKYMPSQNQQDLTAAVAKEGGQLNPDWVEWLMGFPPGWTDIDADTEITPRGPHWWDVEPPIPRVAAGVAHRVGRLKCLGNAVVPAQFYPIFAAIAAVEGGINP